MPAAVRAVAGTRRAKLEEEEPIKLRIFRALAIRDFALLWAGTSVSLLGDGVYLVAIAWQVYELSNAPAALAVVGMAWTVPQLAFLLLGGVLSDRVDRRKMLVIADALRGFAVTALGVLSIAGELQLWHVVALVALYGVGEAFFAPAFGAIVPSIVPQELLVEANSLEQFVQPIALRLVGPALGGWLIAATGVGEAFLLDALTFAACAAAALLMRPRPVGPATASANASTLDELRDGLRFVRSQAWLWGTLIAASVALLAFYGPSQVLLPYEVKNRLGGDAADLGLILAAAGLGSVVSALAIAQLGRPRRHVTAMYAGWSIAAAAPAGYGLATGKWQFVAVAFSAGMALAVGNVLWATLIQTLVPARLLGRVTSVDWLVSTGLIPVSFAITAPLAEAFGTRTTLLGAGLGGAAAIALVVFLPGIREPERVPRAQAAMAARLR